MKRKSTRVGFETVYGSAWAMVRSNHTSDTGYQAIMRDFLAALASRRRM